MKNVLFLAIILAFSGCASVSPASQKMLTRLGVSYAVAKVIENNPTYGPRITEIAHDVRLVAGGEKLDTVERVMDYVRGAIRWDHLSAADAVLVEILLEGVKSALIEKVGPGTLTGENVLAVAEVAGWIEDAARAARPRTTT